MPGVKVRGRGLNTLHLRLAETLQVRDVSSQEFGRLLRRILAARTTE